VTGAPFERVIAVDWSGAREPAGALAVAEVRGEATGIDAAVWMPASREETTALLLARARTERVAIGLDFAFSYPRWFVERQRCADGVSLWRRVSARGERWLAEMPPPFSRTQLARTSVAARGLPLFRATELALSVGARVTPKSAFQIGGSGQVGMSTRRGIPFLLLLQAAGCAIWPFDVPASDQSVVLEIYPRAVYGGAVAKADAAQRAAWLDARAPHLATATRDAAARGDHAFDALASALALWDARAALATLPDARGEVERLEGRIWTPGLAA
jgi:hypothetical protein